MPGSQNISYQNDILRRVKKISNSLGATNYKVDSFSASLDCGRNRGGKAVASRHIQRKFDENQASNGRIRHSATLRTVKNDPRFSSDLAKKEKHDEVIEI